MSFMSLGNDVHPSVHLRSLVESAEPIVSSTVFIGLCLPRSKGVGAVQLTSAKETFRVIIGGVM